MKLTNSFISTLYSLTMLTVIMAYANVSAGSESQWKPFAEPYLFVPELNVYIPDKSELSKSLRVAAFFNHEYIQIRFQFDTDHPSWYHDYLVYENGNWNRLGHGVPGPEKYGMYEDRIAMMLDDGSVPGFAKYGGYVVMHPGIAGRTDEAPTEEVRAHPWHGVHLGEEEVTKFILPSRIAPAESDLWRNIKPAEALTDLQKAGIFIDTWQWRAHRSNPIGWADNGYILDARQGAAGQSMYSTNWSDEDSSPLFMYDIEKTGMHALSKDTLLNRAYSQDEYYYLADDFAIPYDPTHPWQEGDVIPRRILQEPSGNRAAVKANGRWSQGTWDVALTRKLQMENTMDSKSLEPGHTYNVAFAVHTGATQGRWHYVSMPLQFSLGNQGHIIAQEVTGDLDEAENEKWVDIPLFYVGQATFKQLTDESHEVYKALQQAQSDPLNPEAIYALTEALVDHEKTWLTEAGYIEE